MENKSPKIRFNMYGGEWEKHKLGECFEERQERSADGELISVTISDGIKKASDLGRHDNSSDDKSNYKKVEIGDIAYNSMRMWQGASGCSPYSGILSPAYTVLIPNDGVDSEFFSYLFKLPKMLQEFQVNSQGITSDNWNLKYPALSEIDAIFPKIEEQKSIAEYFKKLDDYISLYQNKYEKLVILKRNMMEKMFPQNDSKVPEIRFLGFTSEWEIRKLGDTITEFTDRTSDFETYPLYSLTIEKGVTEKTERYERSFLVTKDTDLFKIVLPGSFVSNPMNLRFGAIGYNQTNKSVSVSGYYDVFSIDESECSQFWQTYLKTDIALKKYDIVATGSLIEKRRVHFSELKDIVFLEPGTMEEKKRIGDFFWKLDNMIVLQQQKIQKLKNIKSSSMLNMFA